jgi:hypothetical protein
MEIMYLSVHWHRSQYALLAIGLIMVFAPLLCVYLHFGPSELSNLPDISYKKERGFGTFIKADGSSRTWHSVSTFRGS